MLLCFLICFFIVSSVVVSHLCFERMMIAVGQTAQVRRWLFDQHDTGKKFH